MKKTVFITGGTGVMGYAALKKFVDHTDDYEVRAFVRDSEANHKKMEKFADKFQIIWGDLTDYDLISRCMEGVDYVLHMGALINPLATDFPPEVTLRTNYGSTKAMIRGIKQYGQEEKTHLVYIGTVEETGPHFIPHHWGRVGDPLQPPMHGYYALSKCAAERAVAESGLKYWVSLRMSFLHPNGPKSGNYPIIGMVTDNNCAEHIDDESSGNLMLQVCSDAVPEKFWRRGYNIGGGEGLRLTQNQYVEKMHGNSRDGFKPKWVATRNFHGQFFSDSDLLNELVPYRLKSADKFFKDEFKNMIKGLKSAPKLTPEETLEKNRQICAKPGGTVWAAETGDEETIRVLFGSVEKFNAIPDSWDDIPVLTPSHTPTYLDHGFDETKPQSELNLDDMKKAAEFRGGKCLSESMVTGDLFTPLKWQCADGHVFMATPNLVLNLGHWCPDCLTGKWDYFHQARVNPFFAQTWDYAHADEEPYAPVMECDARFVDKEFE